MSTETPPGAFEAYDDIAAYVDGRLSRSKAITEGRDACYLLGTEYRRREVRARRVLMRSVGAEEADELFGGEFESGWVEVTQRPLNVAQRQHLIPMWRVEPA